MTHQLNFNIKKIALTLLSIIVGIIFVFSALAKIPSLEIFGWTIVETTFLNWTFAEWIARVLIGLELALGIAFILQLQLKKITIPVSLFILIVFTFYLIMIWIQYGNTGNCGCFGELLPMTPLQSILKNGGLIIGILILYKTGSAWHLPKQSILLTIITLLSLAFPIIQSPPESIYIFQKEPLLHNPIPLSILYHSSKNKAPNIELRKGKHIISFLSLTCEFCRKAAIRMRIMKQEHPSLPFYFILNGDTTNLKSFFDETKATNIDYIHFNGPEDFVTMNGSHSFPTIKWVNDTTVIRESNYITLDEHEILDWIK